MTPNWDKQKPPEPTEVKCPKCGQTVGIDKVHGRVRTVTVTVTHIAKGRVCHAILNTKETR